jgi:hypothetical protein|tara:strand:+ start:512 stop:1225 length:714 start_codon:yes stop_codon:yes gene_type:complete
MHVVGKIETTEIGELSSILEIPGFKPFNESLKFLDGVIQQVNAKGERWKEEEGNFDHLVIKIVGESSTNYKIEIEYNEKLALKFFSGYSKLNLPSQEKELGTLLNLFQKIFTYGVYWMDERDEEWKWLCVHEFEDEGVKCWPADVIASLILTLRNDLHSALKYELYTIRESLLISLPLNWAIGKTNAEFGIKSVSEYCDILSSINSMKKEEIDAYKLAARIGLKFLDIVGAGSDDWY